MGRIRSAAQFILMINRHRENINHPMRCKHFKLIPRHFWMPMASLKTIEQPNEIEGTNRPNKLKDAIQRKRRHQNLVWPCVLFACTYMVRCKCPDGKPVPVCVCVICALSMQVTSLDVLRSTFYGSWSIALLLNAASLQPTGPTIFLALTAYKFFPSTQLAARLAEHFRVALHGGSFNKVNIDITVVVEDIT